VILYLAVILSQAGSTLLELPQEKLLQDFAFPSDALPGGGNAGVWCHGLSRSQN